MKRVRVKICGLRDARELTTAVEAGADAAGFLVGRRHVSEHFIPARRAASLTRDMPPFVTPVLTTHLARYDDVAKILDITGISTLQLHGGADAALLTRLHDTYGCGLKLLFALHVGSGRVSPLADGLVNLLDAVVLDSADPAAGRVGGTGKTHDWSASGAFCRESPLPCILAGGLTPENVREAIEAVHPHAVDVNTGVRSPEGNTSPRRCRAFVRSVLSCSTGKRSRFQAAEQGRDAKA